MTYASKIAARQQDTFAELYEITCGFDSVYYTSYSEEVSFLGNTYEPRPIKRSDFSFSKELRAVNLRITAPIDDNFARYVANAPVEPITITVWRIFVGSTDYVQIFRGDVIDVTLCDHVATVVCENSTEIFRNKVPRIIYQAFCNHELFDAGCAISEGTYQVPAIVTVSGSTLISATFAGYPAEYFVGGHVKAGADYRMITNHVTNTITLQVPFPASSVETGGTVIAYPGCKKDPSTCISKFNNFAHFLGFPYIPSSNPTIWSF